MNDFFVRTSPRLIFFSIHHHTNKIKKNIQKLLSEYLIFLIFRFFSLPKIINLCRLPLPISNNIKRDRETAKIWQRNHQFILGKSAHIGHMELARRRFMLNSACHHLQPEIIGMLFECAAELELARAKVIEGGHLPIFAPMHTLSDVLAGIAVTMTAPKRTHIYSIYPHGFLGKKESENLIHLGLEVFYHHPAESPALQRVIFRELKSSKANVIIFPDALPQGTFDSLGYAMPSHKVTLFGRPASLHSGAEKIANIVDGKLIAFYVYWNEDLCRLSIRIFPPCEDGNMLASCMEQTLKERGDQWPLWHFPSLFYFNDAGH